MCVVGSCHAVITPASASATSDRVTAALRLSRRRAGVARSICSGRVAVKRALTTNIGRGIPVVGRVIICSTADTTAAVNCATRQPIPIALASLPLHNHVRAASLLPMRSALIAATRCQRAVLDVANRYDVVSTSVNSDAMTAIVQTAMLWCIDSAAVGTRRLLCRASSCWSRSRESNRRSVSIWRTGWSRQLRMSWSSCSSATDRATSVSAAGSTNAPIDAVLHPPPTFACEYATSHSHAVTIDATSTATAKRPALPAPLSLDSRSPATAAAHHYQPINLAALHSSVRTRAPAYERAVILVLCPAMQRRANPSHRALF